MSGVRSEPVEVWLINGRPARFVWRERLYTVLSILERPGAEPVPPAGRHGGAGPRGGEGAEPEPSEWRCWRVTASAARNVPPTAYRLCQDVAADRWLLTRHVR